ncbi:MFS transporter [Conexibacter woesei]|uniref:Major facilitator superfamily MFS_1 n=1 Tax=Conexibacter woesei (strain DSM 14684 / CCUG 47730 / CIP 108061 / JCM 11494 / NBRC 100937 / ID131577) TaxID=469383 RepID=D3F0R4_CONWI|nr:MFS transporter [Conexibacter woesei]ADB53998.1 major facilitator superfamily MFS_1 [Conexibacter woesei DSM 14684]
MTAHAHDAHDGRRWWILAMVATAQLLVVLDVTIVNIALPSAQRDLGFSDDDRQWVITAYALAFGSLLLLGGRIGDLVGRKPAFVTGLLGFAGASALGGAAQSFELLVAARALQGVCAALLAPAALAYLSTTFTDPAERAKAFGVYGAISGMGGAFGLLLGGALAELLDWRWCMYVALLFAVPAAIGGLTLLGTTAASARPRLDIPGTLAASAGLFALVFGVAHAEREGWGDPATVAWLGAAAGLLLGFVALQLRVAHPLLPLRVVADRDRGGALLAIGLTSAGAFGVFLFLTFYLQATLGFNPLETGLAFLPMSAVVLVSATTTTMRVLPRTGARPLIPAGMMLAAGGLVLLTRIGVDSGYVSHVLPPLLVIGIGFGMVMAPSYATATWGVPPQDSGVASATVGTSQQVGGSIGVALLSTLAAASVSAYATDHGSAPDVLARAAVEGYTTAFWWAAGLFAAGALVCGALLRSDTRPATSHDAPSTERRVPETAGAGAVA